MKYFIGIDNGVSGTIAIIKPSGDIFFSKTPVKKELSYTKAKQYISRIDVPSLRSLLSEQLDNSSRQNIIAVIERPMVNPGRFKATASALRSLEATLIVLEELGIPYSYIDSKGWQKILLPSGLKGEELKSASLDIGKRLFPSINLKHPDYDGLLIAEYARRKQL